MTTSVVIGGSGGLGRLVTMDEVADATDFLLKNSVVNAHDLFIDGGILVT